MISFRMKKTRKRFKTTMNKQINVQVTRENEKEEEMYIDTSQEYEEEELLNGWDIVRIIGTGRYLTLVLLRFLVDHLKLIWNRSLDRLAKLFVLLQRVIVLDYVSDNTQRNFEKSIDNYLDAEERTKQDDLMSKACLCYLCPLHMHSGNELCSCDIDRPMLHPVVGRSNSSNRRESVRSHLHKSTKCSRDLSLFILVLLTISKYVEHASDTFINSPVVGFIWIWWFHNAQSRWNQTSFNLR